MGDSKFALRTWLTMFVAFAITILFVMSSTALWRHNFRETILFLSLGATLTFLIYRKSLTLLAAGACALIVVNGGLTAVFHPSLVGILVTLACFVGLVFFSRRVGKQHPGLLPDDWQKQRRMNKAIRNYFQGLTGQKLPCDSCNWPLAAGTSAAVAGTGDGVPGGARLYSAFAMAASSEILESVSRPASTRRRASRCHGRRSSDQAIRSSKVKLAEGMGWSKPTTTKY